MESNPSAEHSHRSEISTAQFEKLNTPALTNPFVRWLSQSFLLPACLFVLPLIFQIPEFSRIFYYIAAPFRSTQQLFWATMAACFVTAILGWIAFRGWRFIVWALFLCVLTIGNYKAHIARQEWSIWQNDWDFTLSQRYFLQILALSVIPLTIWFYRCRQPVTHWVLMSVKFIVSIQACVTVFQYLMIKGDQLTWLQEWGLAPASMYTPRNSGTVYPEAVRLTGYTNSPIILGMVLVLTWPALLLKEWPLRTRSLSHLLPTAGRILLAGTAVWAIVLTYTRAAYIGLMIQCGIMLLWTIRSKNDARRLSRTNLIITIIALIMSLLLSPASTARVGAITDTADASIGNRIQVYKVALTLLSEKPLTGWGPGFFNVLYNNHYKIQSTSYSFYDVHSACINFAMEVGIGGMLLAVLAIAGIRILTLLKSLPAWVILGLAGVAVPLCSDTPAANPVFLYPLLWMLGIVAITSINNSTNHNTSDIPQEGSPLY